VDYSSCFFQFLFEVEGMIEAGSGFSNHPTGEGLQSLLERAVRESLSELGSSALKQAGGVPPQSVECIIRNTAHRLACEAGSKVVPDDPAQHPEVSGQHLEPLLADLSATPWVVWREAPPSLTQRGWEDNRSKNRVPELEISSDSVEEQPRLEEQQTAPETTALHVPLRRRRHSSAGDEHPADPTKHMPVTTSCGKSGIGDCPLLVQGGLTIHSNSAQHLMMKWNGKPRSALIIAKKGDSSVVATLQDMAAWLLSQGIVVVLEPELFDNHPGLRDALKNARIFSGHDELSRCIDLVITIGGDGTLTWAVSRFHGAMPPVISFAAGSLGFLTPFPLDSWVRTLTQLLDLHQPKRPLRLSCRMRLQVTVRRHGESEPCSRLSQLQCLNEVLVHRGNSGCVAKLHVNVDGERVTLLQGDGLILATPTGSTAYSLAAGGSMVHPGVPAILLTPVSPHSLSFRPAVLPESAVITVGVPLSARCGTALGVDGKDICMLNVGDSLEVSMSPHPVPTLCRATEMKDWFASVHESLQWNRRLEQM